MSFNDTRKDGAVANIVEIGYNEVDRISALARASALRRIPSHEARGSGELWVPDYWHNRLRCRDWSVCTRVAVVITLLFVPAGRKNHAWFGAYVSSHAAVLA